MKNFIALALCLSALSACANDPVGYQTYLTRRGPGVPDGLTFNHCHGYGCQIMTPITLTNAEWAEILTEFKVPAKTPAEERAEVAQAVGHIERIVGPKDHTDTDVAGTFRQTGSDQLDCVDESTNTTSYLAIIQAHGLLHFHTLEGPQMRVPIVNPVRWPHQTAVLRENDNGTEWVIDSWFQNNGAPADVIDLPTWKNGWKPSNVHGFL